jgi:predicted nucleic acid-binding protein
MSPAAFIDANVPIYAAGRPHPLKAHCVDVLALAAEHPERFITDAEVLQELLHRYLAPERWQAGAPVLAAFASLMAGRTEPVIAQDVMAAAKLAGEAPGVSARDVLHAAVMVRVGCHRVISADRDFDRIPGLQRLDPAEVA